jgi:hypothetical protein
MITLKFSGASSKIEASAPVASIREITSALKAAANSKSAQIFAFFHFLAASR